MVVFAVTVGPEETYDGLPTIVGALYVFADCLVSPMVVAVDNPRPPDAVEMRAVRGCDGGMRDMLGGPEAGMYVD
jgi:hypothetical protein